MVSPLCTQTHSPRYSSLINLSLPHFIEWHRAASHNSRLVTHRISLSLNFISDGEQIQQHLTLCWSFNTGIGFLTVYNSNTYFTLCGLLGARTLQIFALVNRSLHWSTDLRTGRQVFALISEQREKKFPSTSHSVLQPHWDFGFSVNSGNTFSVHWSCQRDAWNFLRFSRNVFSLDDLSGKSPSSSCENGQRL